MRRGARRRDERRGTKGGVYAVWLDTLLDGTNERPSRDQRDRLLRTKGSQDRTKGSQRSQDGRQEQQTPTVTYFGGSDSRRPQRQGKQRSRPRACCSFGRGWEIKDAGLVAGRVLKTVREMENNEMREGVSKRRRMEEMGRTGAGRGGRGGEAQSNAHSHSIPPLVMLSSR